MRRGLVMLVLAGCSHDPQIRAQQYTVSGTILVIAGAGAVVGNTAALGIVAGAPDLPAGFPSEYPVALHGAGLATGVVMAIVGAALIGSGSSIWVDHRLAVPAVPAEVLIQEADDGRVFVVRDNVGLGIGDRAQLLTINNRPVRSIRDIRTERTRLENIGRMLPEESRRSVLVVMEEDGTKTRVYVTAAALAAFRPQDPPAPIRRTGTSTTPAIEPLGALDPRPNVVPG